MGRTELMDGLQVDLGVVDHYLGALIEQDARHIDRGRLADVYRRKMSES